MDQKRKHNGLTYITMAMFFSAILSFYLLQSISFDVAVLSLITFLFIGITGVVYINVNSRRNK